MSREIPRPIAHVRQFFRWDHLPPHLQAISRPFAELADRMIDEVPANPETTIGLRKLLEAKDAFVRARVCEPAPAAGPSSSSGCG